MTRIGLLRDFLPGILERAVNFGEVRSGSIRRVRRRPSPFLILRHAAGESCRLTLRGLWYLN
jgi:hypothetical protein